MSLFIEIFETNARTNSFLFGSNSVVWNIKSQEQRFVDLTPDDNWGGAGLLGVTIRLDNYGGADERLIRVLEVENNSPASQAGLVPLKDYLLGTTAIAFGSTKQLAEVLDAHLDHFVEIYVYNSDSDKVRVISLQPTFSWGGRGMLGAEVGTGYLHRLPKSCRSTVGQSVERKVRLTSKNIATTSVDDTTTTPSEKGGGGTTESAATTSASSNGENSSSQVLEVEPHLEMEVEKDSQGNLNINPEDLTKQPHQLGTSEEEETTTNGHQQQQTGGKQDSSSSETLDDKLDQQSAPSSKTMFSAASTPPSQQKLQHQNYDASDSSLAVQVPQSRIAASPSSLPDPPISTTTDETAAGMPNNNAFSDLPPPPKMAY